MSGSSLLVLHLNWSFFDCFGVRLMDIFASRSPIFAVTFKRSCWLLFILLFLTSFCVFLFIRRILLLLLRLFICGKIEFLNFFALFTTCLAFVFFASSRHVAHSKYALFDHLESLLESFFLLHEDLIRLLKLSLFFFERLAKILDLFVSNF